jgi:transposase
MRKGFDGLAALVKQSLREDPLSGDLFLFMGRNGKLANQGFALGPDRLHRHRQAP